MRSKANMKIFFLNADIFETKIAKFALRGPLITFKSIIFIKEIIIVIKPTHSSVSSAEQISLHEEMIPLLLNLVAADLESVF